MRKVGWIVALFLVVVLAVSSLSPLMVKLANAQITTPAPSLPSLTDATLLWNQTYTDSNLNSVASSFQTADGGLNIRRHYGFKRLPHGLGAHGRSILQGSAYGAKLTPTRLVGDGQFWKVDCTNQRWGICHCWSIRKKGLVGEIRC